MSSHEFDDPTFTAMKDHTSSPSVVSEEMVSMNSMPAAAAAANYVAPVMVHASIRSQHKRKPDNELLDFKRKRGDEVESFSLFLWLEKWFNEVRERPRENDRINKLVRDYETHVPHLVYCTQHKRFSSPEAAAIDRDESCRICLHKELVLSPHQYHATLFPCDAHTREGMEKDRLSFADAWFQYVQMIENVENIHIADANRQRMRRSLVTRWLAFQQQALYAANSIREAWKNGRELDADTLAYYKSYFDEAIVASLRYLQVDVFRMMCVTHHRMVDALPVDMHASKYESCLLCRNGVVYRPNHTVHVFHREGNLVESVD